MADSGATTQTRATALTPRRITAIVVLALFVLFALQNRSTATVQLLVFELTGPLWLTLVCSFLLGGAVVWLLARRQRR